MILKTRFDGELALTDALPQSQHATDESFGSLSTAASYLPRVQLSGSNSALVQEGKVPVGHWVLVTSKDSFIDLGETFDFLNIAWRPKAMQIDGDNIDTRYNPQDPVFQAIEAKGTTPNSGCLFGPEFLIWIPQLEQYATYFMASKTARRAAPNMKANLKKRVTLKAQFIKKGRFAWHGPVVLSCSTPFDIPELAQIVGQATTFASPPAATTEADTSVDREQ